MLRTGTLAGAAVGVDVAQEELERLAAHRVCGLRVNFVSPQSWGETTPHMLQTLARKAARLGWHIQVFAHPQQLLAMRPLLAALPVPLVIDHMARVDPAEGTAGAAFASLLRLLDAGKSGASSPASTCVRERVDEVRFRCEA